MERADRTVFRVALFIAAAAVVVALVMRDRYVAGFALVPALVALWLWIGSRSE